MTFVVLWCLSHYDVCRIMTFVVYDVCRIMMFVAYWVCRLMTFVALWRLSPYDVCSLWGLMACRLWRLSQCLFKSTWVKLLSIKFFWVHIFKSVGYRKLANILKSMQICSQLCQKNFFLNAFPFFSVKWVYHKLYIFQFQMFDTNWPSLMYILHIKNNETFLTK